MTTRNTWVNTASTKYLVEIIKFIWFSFLVGYNHQLFPPQPRLLVGESGGVIYTVPTWKGCSNSQFGCRQQMFRLDQITWQLPLTVALGFVPKKLVPPAVFTMPKCPSYPCGLTGPSNVTFFLTQGQTDGQTLWVISKELFLRQIHNRLIWDVLIFLGTS